MVKKGDVVLCRHCGEGIIVHEEPRANHIRGWVKNADGQWRLETIGFDLVRPIQLHPNPDRVYADFAAAQLLNQV